MPNYRRVRRHGGTYFFTVNLADRTERLLVEHIDSLRRAFAHARRIMPFELDGIVVLPDHLHCIWTLPAGDDDFASRWRELKASFSRTVSTRECVSASRSGRFERGIWQRRFWEHVIRDDSDFAAHLDYIHYNPVKHGHAKSAWEWPYSSFRRWVRAGVYPPNWGGGPDVTADFGES